MCLSCCESWCYQAVCQGPVPGPHTRAVLSEFCSSRVYPAPAPDAAKTPAPAPVTQLLKVAGGRPGSRSICLLLLLIVLITARENSMSQTPRGRTGLTAAVAFCPSSVSPQWRGEGTKSYAATVTSAHLHKLGKRDSSGPVSAALSPSSSCHCLHPKHRFPHSNTALHVPIPRMCS